MRLIGKEITSKSLAHVSGISQFLNEITLPESVGHVSGPACIL